MCRLLFRIVFLIILLTSVAVQYSHATGHSPSAEGKKYVVTFGDSYHNYSPGGMMRIGIIFKNSTSIDVKVSQDLMVLDSAGVKVWKTFINLELLPNQSVSFPLMVPVAEFPGTYTLTTSDTADGNWEGIPSIVFNVIRPNKSPRLKKILVHTPDNEEELNKFLKTWEIKAPSMSWGQVLLLGKKSRMLFEAGDREICQLVDNGLEDNPHKMALPFNISVSFIKATAPEQSFILKPDYKELNYSFKTNQVENWNGCYGITVPATDLRFDGEGVKINAYVTAGKNPYRFPVVELIPLKGKGKIYICQLITDGRLDELGKPPRNQPHLPAYDPMAVHFLLNLISASVGDNLLK
jgi:hypothetical protein